MVEIVIDNTQAQISGTWQTSTFQPNFYGANYHFTNRSAFSALPRVVVWRPSLPAAGAYTVSVWLPDGGVNNDRSSSVKYRVHHSGQVSEFIIDQTVTGGYWRTLGAGPSRSPEQATSSWSCGWQMSRRRRTTRRSTSRPTRCASRPRRHR